jgi:hypothetical protein
MEEYKLEGSWEKFKIGDTVKLKGDHYGTNVIPWSHGTILLIDDSYVLQEARIATDLGIEITEYTDSLEHVTGW